MRARLLGLMTAVALISASGLGASNDLEWTESVSVGRSETYQAESNTPLDDLGTTLEIPLPDAARLAGYEIARVSTLVQLVNDFQGRARARVIGVTAQGRRTTLATLKAKSQFFGLAFGSEDFTPAQLAGYDHLLIVFSFSSETVLGEGLHVRFSAGVTGMDEATSQTAPPASARRSDVTLVNHRLNSAGSIDAVARNEAAPGKRVVRTSTPIPRGIDELGEPSTTLAIYQVGTAFYPEPNTPVHVRARVWKVIDGRRQLIMRGQGTVRGRFASIQESLEIDPAEFGEDDEIRARFTFVWRRTMAAGSELFAAVGVSGVAEE